MFKGISRRLLLYYLLVIALVVIMMGAFFTWFMNFVYMQILKENLYIQARLAAALIGEMSDRDASAVEIDDLSKNLGDSLGIRLTLVDPEGKVLADSVEDPSRMENHGRRPEIVEALNWQKGFAVRYSSTLTEDMLYLAVPLDSVEARPGGADGSVSVMRLALPLAGVNRALFNLVLSILVILFVSALVALAAAVILSRRITVPIKAISAAANAIAAGNYEPPIPVQGSDELAELAVKIREMGRSLKIKIEQVLGEKNKLEKVVSSMSSGIILTDDKMNIELINPAAEELFDLKNLETTGMALGKALRYYTLHENLKAVYTDGQTRLIELNIYYPRPIVLETYLLPVTGSDERIIGALLLFHEVTHLRSIEKMRSDFVANASHELRTPLTTIRGFTETIIQEELSREQLLDFLEVIDRETKRLSTLLDDLLDLAQVENEKGFVKKEVLNLGILVDDVLGRVDGLGLLKDVHIQVRREEEPLLVKGNYDWLCQALVNILENSIRHGRPGGQVKLSVEGDLRQVSVEIEDDGPGIPEADLPYVFERFYRVDKARSRKSGGTGLGLSIVKHIMEAHGAEYELKSGAGRGTVFRFSLPRERYDR